MKHRIRPSADIAMARGNPVDCFREWSEGRASRAGILLVDFDLPQHWVDGRPLLPLTAIYLRCDGAVRVAVTDQVLAARGNLAAQAQFECWVMEHRLYVATAGQPLPLHPEYIPKPWGQEIWFTGVEQRGVCRVGSADAGVPIPWLRAAMPESAAGDSDRPLVLLKILDPFPSESTGDLYFELHREKREIYVVTRVDPVAWPGGRGAIRYGFDPDKLAAAPSEDRFRADYLVAVQAYEAVRRQLDARAPGEKVDPRLRRQERMLRARMDAFTHLRPLEAGDVVVVPPLMPHALQHGVRAVEFQTPVYERQILSFTQRVLSQNRWDTDAAVRQMRLTPPAMPEFECLQRAPGLVVERIVDFPDFEVRRVRATGGDGLELSALDDYALVMVIEGELAVAGKRYGPEQALLLPRRWSGRLGVARPRRGLIFLLALPRA